MEQIPLPTVTLEDLARFQVEHFQQLCFPFNNTENDSHVCAAEGFADIYGQNENETLEDDGDDAYYDDGLGYYADGVKRTLSDEQIKIFRHSEIHSLLRERQRLREEEEEQEEEEEEPDHEHRAAVANDRAQRGQRQAFSNTRNNGKRANDAEDETAEPSVMDRPAKQPKHDPIVEAHLRRKLVSYSDD